MTMLVLALVSLLLSLGEPSAASESRATALRRLLQRGTIVLMPCCYDGVTARLVEQAGFELTFMTGFGVSASQGLPDLGLVSAGEMVRAAQVICESLVSIPCIGDGDTGYGNPANVRRTVRSYAQAGLAGIMIEDQVAPKRCGHTRGKQVVSREEAAARVQAAVDARNEGSDIVILARTDARQVGGLDEAIERCRLFMELGADWTFLEAPQSVEEMRRYCQEVKGPKLANMLEFGLTPVLSPQELQELGYSVAAYPLTLLSAGTRAMQMALERLRQGKDTTDLLLEFSELQRVLGFPEYYETLERYKF